MLRIRNYSSISEKLMVERRVAPDVGRWMLCMYVACTLLLLSVHLQLWHCLHYCYLVLLLPPRALLFVFLSSRPDQELHC